jgi:hypothetical protein
MGKFYAPNCASKVGKVTKNGLKTVNIHTKMQRKTRILHIFLHKSKNGVCFVEFVTMFIFWVSSHGPQDPDNDGIGARVSNKKSAYAKNKNKLQKGYDYVYRFKKRRKNR